MRKDFKSFKQEALKNPEVRAIYDSLSDEFELKSKLISLRKAANMTQEEIAKKMNTTKSSISRLESLNAKNSPSLATLKAYANALGKKLKVEFL